LEDTFDALKEMVRDAVHCHFEESTRPQIIPRDRDPLRVGTVSSILADVASYLEISRAELVNTLFG
jgi:hypothetical protein